MSPCFYVWLLSCRAAARGNKGARQHAMITHLPSFPPGQPAQGGRRVRLESARNERENTGVSTTWACSNRISRIRAGHTQKNTHTGHKHRSPDGLVVGSCTRSQPRPGWAPDPLMVGIRSPHGLVVGSCTSHPGVLGSIPKREEPGKTGAPCVKVPGSSRVPAPPWVGSRSPRVVGIRSRIGLVVGSCTSHPGVLGPIPKREEPGKTGAPCVKVPGSSRVPVAHVLQYPPPPTRTPW